MTILFLESITSGRISLFSSGLKFNCAANYHNNVISQTTSFDQTPTSHKRRASSGCSDFRLQLSSESAAEEFVLETAQSQGKGGSEANKCLAQYDKGLRVQVNGL